MPWEYFEDRASWLEARRQGIGSSDVPAVLGASRFKSPLDVWALKVGLAEPDPDNRFMQAGRYLEPAVVRWFQDDTGIMSSTNGENAMFVSEAHSWMRVTPDRLIPAQVETAKWDGAGVLEIKTASQYMLEEWEDEPPLSYQMQIQYQMGALDLKWGILCVLVGGNDLRWFHVERNDNFLSAVTPTLQKFWDCVVAQKEPEAIMPQDLKAWEHLHPGDEAEEVHLGEAYVAMDEEIQKLKEDEKALAASRKRLEARLKHAIGDAEVAYLPSGVSYSYRTINIEAATIQRKASRYRRLTRRKPK